MGLVVTYPLMKRITYWPQLFLGGSTLYKLNTVVFFNNLLFIFNIKVKQKSWFLAYAPIRVTKTFVITTKNITPKQHIFWRLFEVLCMLASLNMSL